MMYSKALFIKRSIVQNDIIVYYYSRKKGRHLAQLRFSYVVLLLLIVERLASFAGGT
jgi:hypothetical protein